MAAVDGNLIAVDSLMDMHSDETKRYNEISSQFYCASCLHCTKKQNIKARRLRSPFLRTAIITLLFVIFSTWLSVLVPFISEIERLIKISTKRNYGCTSFKFHPPFIFALSMFHAKGKKVFHFETFSYFNFTLGPSPCI